MNVLKPDRNILVVSAFAAITNIFFIVYIFLETEVRLASWIVLSGSCIITYAAVQELYYCWKQYRRYSTHRDVFDEHIKLRNEIVAQLNRVKPLLREIYTEYYIDGHGLDISAIDGSPPFDCLLTTFEDEQFDVFTQKGREFEVVRGYHIPRYDCYAVQVEYDAILTDCCQGHHENERWFDGPNDLAWKRSPENQASNVELRELLEHLQTI